MSETTLAVKSDDLEQLAEGIRGYHEKCLQAAGSALEYARAAGALLIEAKGKVGHGGWLPWLGDHCEFSERTARNYMRVAREWGRILEAKSATGADLTYREGLRLLSALDTDAPAEGQAQAARSFLDWSPEERAFRAERWWDSFAMYTFLLDAKGWEVARIAEWWGRPEWEVEAILRPQPPRRFHDAENGRGWFPEHAQVCYVGEVEGYLAGWRWKAHSGAAVNAEVVGWNELAPQLDALARHHECQYWRARGLSSSDLSESDFVIAGCCAVTDARVGMGIEVCDMTLRQLWERFDALGDVIPALPARGAIEAALE